MTRIEERGRARLKMRFPDWRARFDLAASENFLDVCEAYELAHVGLDYWTRSDAPLHDEMIADYRDLMASLELEAQIWGDRESKRGRHARKG
ncbi:hypothetical protein [Nocardioides sp. NPDC004968]|uniref:hypothetical protein n=1 Tax=Nocardioides sp. NPDC004968 TaxID=3155894 RepID=UPI0033B4656A